MHVLQVLDRSVSDELIGDIIIKKLTSASVVVSFAEIARAARTLNRVRLAAQVRTNRHTYIVRLAAQVCTNRHI